MRPETRLDLLIPLVGLAHLGNRADRHLRGQAEPLADVVVDQLVASASCSPCGARKPRRDGIAGGVERLQRAQERGVLFRLRGQLDEQRLLHGTSMSVLSIIVNSRFELPERVKGSSTFSLAMNGQGLPRRFL